MLDALIRDLSERYGLGDRSQELFGLLMGYIFNERRGGFPGFIDAFREQGHGELVMAWVGQHESLRPLNASDVNMVFGQGLLADWGSRLGVSRATVGAAIAGVLPQLVAALTPDGRIPGIASLAPVITHQAEPLTAGETARIETPLPAMAPRTDALRRPAPAGHTAAAGDVQPATADPAEQRVSEMMAALGGVTATREPPVNAGRPDNWRPAMHRPQTKPRRGLGLLSWLILLAVAVGGSVYAWQLGLLDALIAQINAVLRPYNLWIPPRG